MSEGDIGNGGLRGKLPGRDFTDMFGEKRRPKMPESPSNPEVTDALLNEKHEDLLIALHRQLQKKRGKKPQF